MLENCLCRAFDFRNAVASSLSIHLFSASSKVSTPISLTPLNYRLKVER